MTDFDDIAIEQARDIHAVFGFDATYTAPAGEPVPCRVVEHRNAEVFGEYGQVIERRTALSFLAAQVPVPVRGAVVVSAKGTWAIDRVAQDDGFVVRVWVTR